MSFLLAHLGSIFKANAGRRPVRILLFMSVEGRTRGRRLRLCASDRRYGANRP